MSTLSLDTDNTRSISVMKVKGRVDSDTAPELDNALSKLLTDEETRSFLTWEVSTFSPPPVCGPGQGAQGSPGIWWGCPSRVCFRADRSGPAHGGHVADVQDVFNKRRSGGGF